MRARYASYRREGRILQKKGLISPRADLTRAKPSLAVRKRIESLKGILSGEQQAVVLPDVMRDKFRKAGRRIIGNKVIFDKKPNERIKKVRGEVILQGRLRERNGRRTRNDMFETVILPYGINDIEEFVEWLESNPERAERLLSSGTAFAFTFYGNHSRDTGDAEWLTEYLKAYLTSGKDAWENFTLIRLHKGQAWEGGLGYRRNKPSSSSANRSKRHYEKKSNQNKAYYQTHQRQIRKRQNQYYKDTRRKT